MKSLLARLLGRSTAVSSSPSGSGSPLLAFVDAALLLPPERLIALGTAYGRWIIPADAGLNEHSICYCAGAGEDISFDCALAQRFHCTVRVIDPTPRAIRHFDGLAEAVKAGHPFPINNSTEDHYAITAEDFQKLTLLKCGLSDRDQELKFYLPKNPAHVSCSIVNLQKTEEYFVAQCLRLESIMQRAGDSSIDLLKMDIEGAEYAVIRDLATTRRLPGILLVEFDEIHMPLDCHAGDRIREHIDILANIGMRCAAVEGSTAAFIRK
jgi:FkbM family methyltransferase